MSDTDITGGFRGEPKTVDEWLRRQMADPVMRARAEKLMDDMGMPPEPHIALHAHEFAFWVSWHTGDGFGRIHLQRPDATETMCRVAIPTVGRVVRNQETAAIEDLCKRCLKEYATRSHDR